MVLRGRPRGRVGRRPFFMLFAAGVLLRVGARFVFGVDGKLIVVSLAGSLSRGLDPKIRSLEDQMAHSELDNEFIQRQRESLEQAREELARMKSGLEEDDQDRGEDQPYEASDRGDLGREIHTRQLDETVSGQLDSRLENVERALQKIEEGTYGICDDTEEEIPKGRLEAMPEAVTTVEAQQRRDERRSPGRGGGSL